MSDTPIDQNLAVKTSIRMSEFMESEVDEFREEYNDLIEQAADGDEDSMETFALDSRSDAVRRLIDIGLLHVSTAGIPPGFLFNPMDYVDEDASDAIVECPECFETEQSFLRVKGEDFDTVICLECGTDNPVDEVVREPLI